MIHSKEYNLLLKINFTLFVLIVFFLPFNGFPYFKSIFHELSVELSYYFLYVFVVLNFIYFLKNMDEFKLPRYYSFYFLSLFTIWTLISGVANYEQILGNYFKYRHGIEKFALQFILLSFVYFVGLVFYNFLRLYPLEYLFKIIRRTVFASFIIILFFGFFEYLKKFLEMNNLVENIRGLLTIGYNGYNDRLHSICGEPSWFGVYLSFGLPWILSYFSEKFTLKMLLFYYSILFFAFFSFSRLTTIILLSEVFLFCFLYLFKRAFFNFFLYGPLLLIPPILFNFGILNSILPIKTPTVIPITKFTKTIDNGKEYFKYSNITRECMQKFGFKIGLDNPIFGVGLGQYSFNFKRYVDDECINSPEIKTHISNEDRFWPPAHGLFSRLIAETGIIGIFLWFFVWFLVFKDNFKFINKTGYKFHLEFVVIMSLFGLMLLGFAHDSFRFLGYWVILSLAWRLQDEKQNIH